jgi:8-oxo-dGTP pyrophosphatase MutT (NUDIX family)
VPFIVEGQAVGAVRRDHIPALRAWPRWINSDDDGCRLVAPATERNLALARINQGLREAGLIRAWRDETYAIVTAPGAPPLALIERASARFWGTLTLAAHANGWVAGHDGRPVRLWIARRSRTKATDPGLLDNLVGGGVPHGQTPFEALLREGFEEAGLDAPTMRTATPTTVLTLRCEVAEGLMHEHMHCHDLRLAPECRPVNQDGEVDEMLCLPIAQAVECAASGEMAFDAALSVLDFALRHQRLTDTAEVARLSAALTPLRLGR